MALRNLARHRREGRYAPQYTLGDVAAIGGGELNYLVDGETGRVHIFGVVSAVDPTLAAAEAFEISLPEHLPLDVAAVGDIDGQAESDNGEVGLITGVVANNTLQVLITYVLTGVQDVTVRAEYTPG